MKLLSALSFYKFFHLLIIISSIIYISSISALLFAIDPGTNPAFGNVPKKISIQRGTAISVFTDRGDVAKSSAMTPVGDGTWELFINLVPGATYNFMFFAVATETANGLTAGSTYYDTPPTDYLGTITFPTSTSSSTISGGQAAGWFGSAGSGDSRRLVYIPPGGSTYYVYSNFGHTPNPPKSIYAQPVDTSTIKLLWQYPKDSWDSTNLADVIAGGRYLIYYSTTSAGGPYSLAVTTGGSAVDYTHTGLSSNLTYFYVIVSSDAYRGSSLTGKVDQSGIDNNFVMAFPDLSQASGKARSRTPTYFRVDSIDWEKIGGDNAIVYLTPWEEDARFYSMKMKGRIVKVYLP